MGMISFFFFVSCCVRVVEGGGGTLEWGLFFEGSRAEKTLNCTCVSPSVLSMNFFWCL